MGLVADIINFFHFSNANQNSEGIIPRSVTEFLKDYNNYDKSDDSGDSDYSENWYRVIKIIRKLTSEGILFPVGINYIASPILNKQYDSYGIDTIESPPLDEKYYSYLKVKNEEINYGDYEFLVFGFPHIRNHFKATVKPVVVTTRDNSDDIGSGFLLNFPLFENKIFVTARHCIENMREVIIPECNFANAPLLNIWTPGDERIDLAVLEFEGDAFSNIPSFEYDKAEILDNILTMGYPPINGFDALLISETAQISGYLKSTTGQIIAEEKAYLDAQTYFLISARVKGGNSGGPVINQYGKVIGVVCQLPAEAEARPDILGYGCVIPTETLFDFLQECKEPSNSITKLEFKMTENGFSTI
ncbi:serine protease [Aphanizomenon sp. CS-733/32]|uniref:S1 family peptidase n=1 Tax=Aphanizomenon sp. CS-733/32 TaxID=3021715 RepID=UPI00232E3705|nr:serine protease [Aphanizomenon sp. CS-733/32]MDB9310031.1 serine protease [Aphanizomenon sp. CS-733/32]